MEAEFERFRLRIRRLGGALSRVTPKWKLPRNASPLIALHVVTDGVIKKINLRHRKKNTSTDVLAFAYTEGRAPLFAHEPVGEVFISRDTARRQARTMGHTLADELTVLAAHGSLHVMGFDHETSDAEAKKMAQAELKTLGLVSKNLSALTNR